MYLNPELEGGGETYSFLPFDYILAFMSGRRVV